MLAASGILAMAFSNASRCGKTGGGFVGRCGQTGTGRTLTVRRGETVAVDSNDGDGMHGRYNSMDVRLEGTWVPGVGRNDDFAIWRWEQ